MKFIVHFLSLATAAHSAAIEGFHPKLSARMDILKAHHIKTRREMAAKRLQLQSANTLRNFKPAVIQQDNVECDWANEETCYDDQYNAIGCEPYASGGCPCPAGQEKCGEALEYKWVGYCTEPEYCCATDEELCYDEAYNPTKCVAISAGGCPCPEGQEKCNAMPEWNIAGYCSAFCCTADQETCYDDMYNSIGCEPLATGGCPCPDGQEKCGGNEWWAGTCTTLCCAEDQETCYDESYTPTSCESIALGGCDCPGGQEKCYASPELNIPGFCVDQCCTEEQEMCYGMDMSKQTCVDIAAGGCPCPVGQEKCGADLASGFSGYCATPDTCCTADEELCYSSDWFPQPESCAQIADGGCPCPEGQNKCGAMPESNYAGYCTTLCCEEQTCYDTKTSWEPTSCVAWTEECPSDITYNKQKENIIAMINRGGMTKEAADLRMINAKKAKLMSMNHADQKVIEQIIKAEEIAILRKVKRGSHKVVDKDVPAFMLMVN